jgi:hypothetical protein
VTTVISLAVILGFPSAAIGAVYLAAEVLDAADRRLTSHLHHRTPAMRQAVAAEDDAIRRARQRSGRETAA